MKNKPSKPSTLAWILFIFFLVAALSIDVIRNEAIRMLDIDELAYELKRLYKNLSTLFLVLLFILLTLPAFAQPKPSCTIERVIDGDTFVCDPGTGPESIRLIGVNSPEMNTDEGKKARTFADSVLKTGMIVELEIDIQPRGPYRRLLAYVWIDDVMFNELIAKEGYAQVATYPPNVKYVETFKEAEKSARENKKGLWK